MQRRHGNAVSFELLLRQAANIVSSPASPELKGKDVGKDVPDSIYSTQQSPKMK